jgi:uncharacterized protein YecE (DUF72 family)
LLDKSSSRIGCISWTYPDWQGPFYPEGSKPSEFLSLYSQVFDIVEVDSTFYRTPSASTVRQWKDSTPANFLFSAKLPRKITHESRLRGISNSVKSFEIVIKGLGSKLACIIAQMPPNFKFEKNFEALTSFLGEIDPRIRYAIEFRDQSWFREETYSLLRKKNVSFAWSVSESTKGKVPIEVTTDYLYLRFMGQFGEFSKFDHIQKEKTDILKTWKENLENVPNTVRQAYVLMSNHFEGFAPVTANSFRTLIGLEKINWKEKMQLFSERLSNITMF